MPAFIGILLRAAIVVATILILTRLKGPPDRREISPKLLKNVLRS